MEKHPLQKVIETDGSYECRAYSGRGMGNRECLAVTVGQGDDALGLAAAVIMALGIPGWDGSEHEEIGFAFQNAREDSLGKERIIYFPDVEYVS